MWFQVMPRVQWNEGAISTKSMWAWWKLEVDWTCVWYRILSRITLSVRCFIKIQHFVNSPGKFTKTEYIDIRVHAYILYGLITRDAVTLEIVHSLFHHADITLNTGFVSFLGVHSPTLRRSRSPESLVRYQAELPAQESTLDLQRQPNVPEWFLHSPHRM